MRKLPKTDQEFEKLARDCAAWKYKSHFALYGRNGQTQYGADALSADRSVVVQCKFYDVNKKDSYKELRTAIREDFADALKAFPKMTTFAIATSLPPDTKTDDEFYAMQEEARAAGRKITVETMYWPVMEDCLEACETRLINPTYAEDYERPLFLHERNAAVCLRNLFVPQKYREVNRQDKEEKPRDNLFERIGAFVRDERKELLILEGDAGCGKTSLVQALCWHEQQQDETAQWVLDGRPLVTVRLRDLDKAQITEEAGLLPAILDYLHIPKDPSLDERKQYLLRRFPRAVLVLDGFDELCIIEGIRRYDWLLNRLTRDRLLDWRFVVTSRPNYIPRSIDVPHTILALQHFDEAKRAAWLDRYTDPEGCAQTVDPDMKGYILAGEEEGVSDAPLALYLLAAGNVGLEERENQWRLYHRIFGRELTKREYDKADHPGEVHRDAAYRLAEEIAREMYRGGNERLCLHSEELEPLVERLREDPDLWEDMGGEAKAARLLAKRILGLCCYWKSLDERGAVEFYHNNIRDFFLCEKIYNGMLRIYNASCLNQEAKAEALIAFFRDGFRAGKLENRVCEFIRLRAEFEWARWNDSSLPDKERNPCLPALEREQKLCPAVFQHLLADGTVYDGMGEQALLPAITRILSNAVAVWHPVREAFRQTDERLSWWTNVEAVNTSGLLRHLFTEIFGSLNIYRMNINQTSSHFGYFSCADLRGANLFGANLRGADLSSANLRAVDLRTADLREAQLLNADLRGANLHSADLRNAVLIDTNLIDTDLRDARLNTAKLLLANLHYADLRGADLYRAVLSCAILPDGHNSFDEREQREHLQALKIEGLRL